MTTFISSSMDQSSAMTLTYSYIPSQIADEAEKVANAIDPFIGAAGKLAKGFDSCFGCKQATKLYSGINNEYCKAKSDIPKFRLLTALNVLGYLPVVSVIAAIARVIFALAFPPKSFDCPEFKNAQLSRAVIECIPFSGFPLLFADIVNTQQNGLYS